MNIELEKNLDKDFTATIEELRHSPAGEQLMEINGLAQKNLNFTEFIDNFVDSGSNVADISINPNANSDTKDVTSLIYTMAEPHRKLLAMNKIFYELKKKYGLEQAKIWLNGEFRGETYLHDFPSASFLNSSRHAYIR